MTPYPNKGFNNQNFRANDLPPTYNQIYTGQPQQPQPQQQVPNISSNIV